MSAGARWAIGVATFLFGCGFAAMVNMVPRNGWMCLVLAGFCWLISFACTPLRGAGVAGRVVAGTCSLMTLGYVVVMAMKFTREPAMASLSGDRGDTTLINALILFATWGLPAGIYALSGTWMKGKGKGKATRTAQGELESVVDVTSTNGPGAW